MATRATDLLIVGAGPFGLAAAARCITRGVPYTLLGDPLSFWTQHMPQGMYLRSPYAWHLCPDRELTFERYLEDHTRVDAEVHGVPCIGLNKVRYPGNLVAIEVTPGEERWRVLGEWPPRG